MDAKSSIEEDKREEKPSLSNHFSKANRLLKRREFRAAIRSPIRFVKKNLSVNLLKTHQPSRLGITASRKYGNAVARNRFKRLVRESYRHIKEKFHGYDLNVVPRSYARKAAQSDIASDLNEILDEIKRPARKGRPSNRR